MRELKLSLNLTLQDLVQQGFLHRTVSEHHMVLSGFHVLDHILQFKLTFSSVYISFFIFFFLFSYILVSLKFTRLLKRKCFLKLHRQLIEKKKSFIQLQHLKAWYNLPDACIILPRSIFVAKQNLTTISSKMRSFFNKKSSPSVSDRSLPENVSTLP